MMKQKCSNRQLVSVLFDGEMDSPWKEKMENHIAACGCCARQIDAYRENSLSLVPVKDDLLEEARRRVLQKMETRGLFSGYGNRSVFSPRIWNRRISLPIPAAAAAAVIFMFIAIALLWVIRSHGRTETQNMAITAETEIIQDVLPVSGMESVLQYLGSTDAGEIIILKLPESRNFASYGEPAIIKAADYSRNVPGRRKQ
jgi:hypothetical protein